jgi:DNA-binding NarL/FixJ family response regulator
MPDVLIVDDNAAFREMLSRILLSRFPILTIREAQEGETALQKIETKLPDLIYMDVRLPGENGFVWTRRLKAAYPYITILIMTSYDSPEYREAAFESGADGFLSKRTATPDDIAEEASIVWKKSQ